MILRIGTRTSRLALWQTEYVADLLQAAHAGLTCEVVPFTTQGDKSQQAGIPLPKIGGKGLFTAELEAALNDGRIDLAVHSLKDLPVASPPGLTVGAIPDRADARDVLVSLPENRWTLNSLPAGAVVGTSSLRRQSQLLAARPEIEVRSIRGNVDTRIRKMREGQYDAIVLAAAGVIRLGLEEWITEWLTPDGMLPAPGQGALGIQCRTADEQTLSLLNAIHEPDVETAVTAERAFLSALGGGCSLPVGALATISAEGIALHGRVVSPDGAKKLEVKLQGDDPHALGAQAAEVVLANGGAALLANSDQLPVSSNQSPVNSEQLTVNSDAQEKEASSEDDAHREKTFYPLSLPFSPLSVVVTRSTEQADEFGTMLASNGARPILFPVIRFVQLPTAQYDGVDLNRFDWLIFTSINGVQFFFDAFPTAADQLRNKKRSVKIAVSGSSTRKVLQEHGIEVDFVPEQFVGELLVAGLGDLSEASVLLPRAKQGRPKIAEMLRDGGADLTEIPLYDTVTATPSEAGWGELLQQPDVITFTSPSSVRNFMRLIQERGVDFPFKETRIASIGPITSAEVARFGLTTHIEADPYTLEGLIEAIAHYFKAYPVTGDQ